MQKSTGVQIESLLVTRNFLHEVLHLDIVYFHRCPENHIAYCGKYERFLKCPYCNTFRFFEHSKGIKPTDNLPDYIPAPLPGDDDTEWLPFRSLKPNAIYHYIPLVHRLRLLYADTKTSQELQEYINGLKDHSNPNEKRDIWDGRIMSSLRKEGIFPLL